MAIDKVKEQFNEIAPYVPVVDRVHGPNHPEFHEVRSVFESMQDKNNAEAQPDLSAEFAQLRRITNNYQVPDDVCETFEAVYETLSEADKVYSN